MEGPVQFSSVERHSVPSLARLRAKIRCEGTTMTPKGTIIGLLGIWTIVAGIWSFAPQGESWSDIFIGVIVGILGFSLRPGVRRYMWVNGIAGLWIIASAFIPHLQ